MRKTIDQLAIEFGTDKSSLAHDYCTFYEELFGHLRDKECSILEFGIKTGASLRMWEEAFPKADVIGIDITLKKMVTPPIRAKTLALDLGSPTAIKWICSKYGPFDVAIDDSAHTTEIVHRIIEGVWPNAIKPGGWLVIEDVNSGYKRDLRPEQQHDLIGYCSTMVRAVNHHGNLCKCGPKFWDRSSEFDKAIERIVYVPGLMAMRRRA